MGLFKEFKEFAMRGNVVDMAVGIVIGAAFGKIVSSMVNDVLMPPLGLVMGGVDFGDKKFVLKDAVQAAEGVEAAEAVTLNYGLFINHVLDFVIVAFAIFVVIKIMNRMKRTEEEAPAAAPAAPPEPSNEEKLLAEIRDALVSRG